MYADDGNNDLVLKQSSSTTSTYTKANKKAFLSSSSVALRLAAVAEFLDEGSSFTGFVMGATPVVDVRGARVVQLRYTQLSNVQQDSALLQSATIMQNSSTTKASSSSIKNGAAVMLLYAE